MCRAKWKNSEFFQEEECQRSEEEWRGGGEEGERKKRAPKFSLGSGRAPRFLFFFFSREQNKADVGGRSQEISCPAATRSRPGPTVPTLQVLERPRARLPGVTVPRSTGDTVKAGVWVCLRKTTKKNKGARRPKRLFVGNRDHLPVRVNACPAFCAGGGTESRRVVQRAAGVIVVGERGFEDVGASMIKWPRASRMPPCPPLRGGHTGGANARFLFFRSPSPPFFFSPLHFFSPHFSRVWVRASPTRTGRHSPRQHTRVSRRSLRRYSAADRVGRERGEGSTTGVRARERALYDAC